MVLVGIRQQLRSQGPVSVHAHLNKGKPGERDGKEKPDRGLERSRGWELSEDGVGGGNGTGMG